MKQSCQETSFVFYQNQNLPPLKVLQFRMGGGGGNSTWLMLCSLPILHHLLRWDVSASQILVTAEAHGSSQNFRGSIQHRLWARWSARLSSPPILNVCMCTNVAYTTVCMFVCVSVHDMFVAREIQACK